MSVCFPSCSLLLLFPRSHPFPYPLPERGQHIAGLEHGADIDTEGTQLQARTSQQVAYRAHHHVHFSLLQAPQHALPTLLQALARHGREHDLIGTVVRIIGEQGFNDRHLGGRQELLLADLFLGSSPKQGEHALLSVQNERALLWEQGFDLKADKAAHDRHTSLLSRLSGSEGPLSYPPTLLNTMNWIWAVSVCNVFAFQVSVILTAWMSASCLSRDTASCLGRPAIFLLNWLICTLLN